MREPAVVLGAIPHCDSKVLHAPGECRYCDEHEDWQALRTIWRIAFTGHPPATGEQPCPSDAARGLHGAHCWAGNRPSNVAVPVEQSWASRVFYGNDGRTGGACREGLHNEHCAFCTAHRQAHPPEPPEQAACRQRADNEVVPS